MASQLDVRRIALSLPAAEQPPGRFAFAVPNKRKLKSFVWVWMERVAPKKPRVPNHGVIAVRVADLAEKERLLSADPTKFFTEPHYNGFPAVLVRLDAVSVADLTPLITAAWRCQAPADLTTGTVSHEGTKAHVSFVSCPRASWLSVCVRQRGRHARRRSAC
jgi:hypothetical protein